MCLYLKPAELSAVVQDPDKALLSAVTLSRSAASCSSCCSWCAAVLARLCISKACVLTATSRQFLKHRADKLPGVTTASLLSYFPGTRSHVSLACQPLSAAGDQMKQPCKLVQAIWLPTGAQGNEYMLGTWMLMAGVPSKNLQVPSSRPSPYYKQDVFPSLFP